MSLQTGSHPEEKSQEELRSTEISPGTARAITWAFLAILFSVPVSQFGVETARRQSPQVLNILKPFQAAAARTGAKDLQGAWKALKPLVEREFPRAYEAEVERVSVSRSFFQPRIQALVTGRFHFGNDQSVLGRNGWLFYQPGLDYLTGPDIVESAHLLLATKKMVDKKGEQNPQPDPRPAILQLHAECMRRGIRLVVVPIPDKAMLQPAELTGRMGFSRPLTPPNNRGYARFARELREQGVDVFDVAPGSIQPGEVRYLEQDTHWTPVFMDTVAAGLAQHINECSHLMPPTVPVAYHLAARSVSRVGDLVDMLKLPRDQQLYRPQVVVAQQVIDEHSGQPWRPDSEGDVLLLGDSFTNMYSQATLGWGTSAGFAEHISYHLKRSLDVIAVNGGGASGTRTELSRFSNAERLARKKVLIYEFAIRSLMNESWRLAQLPSPPAAKPIPVRTEPIVAQVVSRANATGARDPAHTPVRAAVPPDARPAKVSAPQPLTVEVLVTKTSRVPKPGTAPYKDCLTFIRIHVERVVSGSYEKPDLIGVFLAMKDDTWLPAATYAVGDRLRLTLTPLILADRQVQSMQRADDLDDFTLDPYFVLSGDKL
jgi:hypothetical protein